MAKLKKVNAMNVKLLHDIAKNYHDQYWRYYMMWYNHCDLADSDPKKFIKQESESGSAMWDDPPEDWSERDLYIWSKGYVHGRCVETGNVSGIMRIIEMHCKRLMNDDYGFRDGLPTVEQVNIHNQKTLIGFWMLLIDHKSKNDMIPRYPMLYCMQVEKNKIRYWDGDKWKNMTKKETKEIISSMPMSQTGIPVSWRSLQKKIVKDKE